MYAIETFANDTFTYSSNIALANNMTWTAQSICVNLDFNTISGGTLTTSLIPIVSTTPNSTNYTLNISAIPSQTANLINGSINPSERVIIIQTKFTSNTGLTLNANNVYLRVKQNGL